MMHSEETKTKEEVEAYYRYEEKRLQTFQNWPQWAKVAPVDLARAGFYFIGKNDIVKCFRCNAEINSWEQNEEPLVEHTRYAPNCPFVTGEDTLNVPRSSNTVSGAAFNPIGTHVRTGKPSAPKEAWTEASHSHPQQPQEQQKGIPGHLYPNMQKGPIEGTLPHYHQPMNVGTTFSIEATNQEEAPYSYMGMRETSHGGQQHETHVPHPGNVPELKRERKEVSQSGSRSPVSAEKKGSPSHTKLPTGATSQTTTNPTTQSSQDRLKREQSVEEARFELLTKPPYKELTEYCKQDDLLELLPNANSPFYSHINNRIATFSSWSSQDTVEAKALAEAGLYYTGTDDQVCCFMCAGKMSNWQRGDIPWYEHSRWFGKCPYLKRCMKHPVINAIVETAKTLSGGMNVAAGRHNHGEGQTQCDTGVVLTETDLSSDVCQTLRRVGYPEERIHSIVAAHGMEALSSPEKFIKKAASVHRSGTTSP